MNDLGTEGPEDLPLAQIVPVELLPQDLDKLTQDQKEALAGQCIVSLCRTFTPGAVVWGFFAAMVAADIETKRQVHQLYYDNFVRPDNEADERFKNPKKQ